MSQRKNTVNRPFNLLHGPITQTVWKTGPTSAIMAHNSALLPTTKIGLATSLNLGKGYGHISLYKLHV